MDKFNTPLHQIDKEYEIKGLKDGGHIILSCSNCQARLVDIWRTQPNIDVLTKFRAMCPLCGDYSFDTKIKGRFHIGSASDNVSIKDYNETNPDVIIINLLKKV